MEAGAATALHSKGIVLQVPAALSSKRRAAALQDVQGA